MQEPVFIEHGLDFQFVESPAVFVDFVLLGEQEPLHLPFPDDLRVNVSGRHYHDYESECKQNDGEVLEITGSDTRD